MRIRSESFNAETPVTFYGVAFDPTLEKPNPHDGTAVRSWFLRFTSCNKAAMIQIATECTNGVRDNLTKEQVKLFEINIDEISW